VVDAENAWDITKGLSSYSIGIVDNGSKIDHVDLQSKIIDYDNTSSIHGTKVAGIAGAVTNNDEGVASLGWNLSLNTYSGIGVSNKVSDIITAISTSDIINMSWMTTAFTVGALELEELCPDCGDPAKWAPVLKSYDYPEVSAAIEDADSAGIICVAAAGNRTANTGMSSLPEECDPTNPYTSSVTIYPASYSNVIAVSATKLNSSTEEFISGFNYGSFIHVSAPGSAIYTTNNSGGYVATESGTSYSSPLVAALCGLIKSINPGLSIEQIKTILKNSADKIDSNNHAYNGLGWNAYMGYGRINAYKALKYTLEYYGGTLTQDIEVESGESLAFSSGAVVNLNSNLITTSGGTMTIANGAEINPYICVKESGVIKGLYPTISEAAVATTASQVIVLNGTISTDIVVPSGETVVIESTADIDMNDHTITTTSGTITIISGAEINPDIRLKSGTTTVGLYSSLSSAFSAGSIVEVRGTHTFSDNYSIASAKTLKPVEEAELKFPPSKILNVYGTLNANNATFTSTSGVWEGIEFKQGSSGDMTECTVENAEIGIHANSYSSSYPTNPTISECTIDDCNYGIRCTNSNPNIEDCIITANTGILCVYSDPNIEDCWIESESSTGKAINNYHGDPAINDNIITAPYGIYNYYSSPTVTNNNIECSSVGLYCATYSSPLLAGEQSHGNNEFSGEVNYGVSTSGNSNPILGYKECGDGVTLATGNNSFDFNSFTYLLYNGGTGQIKAHNNYWGTSTPTSSLFYNVAYDHWHPYLISPPSTSSIISPENSVFDDRFELASVLTEETSAIEEEGDNLTVYYDDSWGLKTKINFLYYLYIIGEAEGVADLCKDIILGHPYDPEAFMALDLIYQISKNEKINKDIEKEVFKTYLKNRDNEYGNQNLNASAEMLLAGMEGKDGLNRLEKVYKKHKDTFMGKYALQQKFMYYFHEEESIEEARIILNLMDEVYPNEAVTYEAHSLIGDEVMNPKDFYKQYHEKDATEQAQLVSTDIAEIFPEEYTLSAAYPNPFNPSTTLEYALPIQSEVECNIYSISGELVKSFNYDQNAGTYGITWNGSNVSSGIYLIRFVADAKDGSESFVDYQKVTLLK
jgi:hypothetical protein